MTVTAAKGFRAAGVVAGPKPSGAPDVALVVNDGPDVTAAGVVSGHRGSAAPGLWEDEVMRGGTVLWAVVLSSGSAVAGAGPEDFQDTQATAKHLAAAVRGPGVKQLMLGPGEVVMCSIGLTAERLPMDRVLDGVSSAVRALARDGGAAAAEAIVTADTRPKATTVAGNGWVVGGMATSAGTLAQGFATMLCVLTTDAVAGCAELSEALRTATWVTFGDVGTPFHDAVLLLASGASGIEPSVEELTVTVTAACVDLVRQVLVDAVADRQLAVETVGRGCASDGRHTPRPATAAPLGFDEYRVLGRLPSDSSPLPVRQS